MTDRAPVFLDTAYVYALVNMRDQWHEVATTWERRLATEKRRLLTTEFVLLEIADGLAAVRYRIGEVRIISALRASSLVEIVPSTSDLFAEALDVYQNRMQNLKPGVTELVLHAAAPGEELTAIAPDAPARVEAYRLITASEAARQLISSEGITLIGYQELRDAQRGGA